MYPIFISLITLITLVLLWIVPRIAGKYGLKTFPAPVWLVVLAALCWATAGQLPDIHISHETTTFQEHFVGGGLYTGILFVYFSKLLGWRPNWLIYLLGMFAWTSALGVLNELAEFTVTKLNITHIDISDTSWDLMANTAGMLVVYLLYYSISALQKHQNNV